MNTCVMEGGGALDDLVEDAKFYMTLIVFMVFVIVGAALLAMVMGWW